LNQFLAIPWAFAADRRFYLEIHGGLLGFVGRQKSIARCLMRSLPLNPEADRHEHFALDGHAVTASGLETPAVANRGQGGLVERVVAAGGFDRRTPHGSVRADQNPQGHDALNAAGEGLGG